MRGFLQKILDHGFKKSLFGICLLFMVFISACQTAPTTRTVSVGVYQNKPKIFINEKGNPDGFFIDLIKEIAKQENWQLEFVTCEWQECLDKLANGQIDLMPDVAYSKERDLLFDFHQIPAAESWSQVYASVDSNITRIDQMKGKKVAILEGSIQRTEFEKLISNYGFTVDFVNAKSQEETFKLVAEGSADAAITNHFFGDYFYQEYGLTSTSIIFNSSTLFFATAQGQNQDVLQAIDDNLSVWREDPNSKYFRILNRWLNPSENYRWLIILGPIVGIVIFLLFVAILWNLSLRKQVQERTKHLSLANQTLRESEERYRLISTATSDYMFSSKMASNGMLESDWVAGAFESITGYTFEEYLRQGGWRSIVHPDDLVQDDRDFEKLKNNQKVISELRNISKDGRTIWVRIYANPVWDPEKNQLIGINGAVKDITAQKSAEEKMIASEHRNKTIVDALPDSLFRVNQDGTFLDFVTKTTNKLYMSSDLVIGKRLADVFPENVAKKCLTAIQQAFDQNRLQTFDFEMKFGQIRSVFEGRVVSNLNEDEAVVIVRDVTTQRQMESKIRKSEEKYRLLSRDLEQRVQERTVEIQDLYDTAPIGYYSLGPDGTFLMINKTELNWLGYSRNEIIGKKKFTDLVTPEGVQAFDHYFEIFKEQGYISNLEFDMIRKDGSTIPVIVNATAIFDDDGNYTQSRSTAFDNTELKAIDAEIRRINKLSDTALELAKAGYWYIPLDESGYYNPSDRVVAIYGNKPRENNRYHLQKDWFDNIKKTDPDLAQHVNKLLMDVLQGQGETFDAEYSYKRPIDGKLIWLHTNGHVVKTSAGKIVGISGVSQDITESRIMQEELRKAKEAAEAANRAKSVFLANMSHEIRTPMNAILGFTQILMKDQEINLKNRNFLETINRSGELLLTIINEILQMSKIEAGHVKYNPGSFNLPELFKDIESMFRLRFEAKNLSLDFELDPHLPEFVVSDENKIKEIMINLLGNAVKFTHKGGVTVRCWPEKNQFQGREEKISLFIDIEDTGVGIAEKDLPLLFQAFEQTSSGAKVIDGTGLGLAISQNHAKLLGGIITVTSTLGVGSCFRVRLEVEKGQRIESSEKTPLRQITGIIPGTRKVKILIVDDHEENRLLLKEFLESVGISTLMAKNGEEAVAVAKKWGPELIFMDLRMPVMDGYEATKKLRASDFGKDIKIVALTASIMDVDKEKVTDSGMNGFLRKPFKDYELFALLEQMLGSIFTYDDQSNISDQAKEADRVSLSAEAMNVLPEEILQKMKQATVNAQFDELMELIKKAEAYSPQIARKLEELVGQFEYDALLELLEKS